jgi:hypothetical protein
MEGAIEDEPPTDALTSAVVETARHTADDDWGLPPRLYALAKRAELTRLAVAVPERISSAPDNALIPIEQDPLPEGKPLEVLASIHWPREVTGCVLVTEVTVLPPDPGDTALNPDDEPWAARYPSGRKARLTVGVLRESDQEAQYACCLRLEEDDALRVSPDLADDLVTALLGTF